jgi:large subunit ribosomal protein L5
MPRLKEKYLKEVIPNLKTDLKVKNVSAVPKISKVVVNMGIGEITKNREMIEQARKDLAAITGQLPSIRQAKISVASFGIRQGQPIGLAVTLRGEKMYSFLDKLFSIVLPRLRDFRGVPSTGFDKRGNYTLGVREHSVFPEIDVVKSQARGLEITIVTTTNDNEAARELLVKLGMPFEKGNK